MIEDREKFIKKLKLDSNINNFILAKSLFSLQNFSKNFLEMVANSVLNRILYEMELNEKMSEVVKVFTSVRLFPSWKNFKNMDLIDVNSESFKSCLSIAKTALSGKLKILNLIRLNFVRLIKFLFGQ